MEVHFISNPWPMDPLAVLYQGVYVGRAIIANTVIQPGVNTISSEFHYAPNDKSQSAILTEFLQRPVFGSSDLIPITVSGDGQSSPYGSLIPALEGVSLNAAFQGAGAQLVNFVHVVVEIAAAFCQNSASMQFKVRWPRYRVPAMATHRGRRSTTLSKRRFLSTASTRSRRRCVESVSNRPSDS